MAVRPSVPRLAEWNPRKKFWVWEVRKQVQEVVGVVHMMVPALVVEVEVVVVVVVEVEVAVVVVVEELEAVAHK
jgi:hypothetical protein